MIIINYVKLREKYMKKTWPIAIDLFAGCGGVTEGLKQARFRVISAVDIDPVASSTYRLNHSKVKFINRDIKDIDPIEVKRYIQDGVELDLLTVCAPCQPFSTQNKVRGNDKRAPLILESLRFIKMLKPKVVFFENVPGLVDSDIFINLDKLIRDEGYHTTKPVIIDAADYGVPQRRPRFIYIASRIVDSIDLPSPITSGDKRLTVKDAIGDLNSLQSGQNDPNDTLHAARNHREIALLRLRHIPKDGGSRSSLPDTLQLQCHKNHNGHNDVYGRMRWDSVAPTLTTGCTNITRGRFAHPEDDRGITVREAARLQTFPDRYLFSGSFEEIAVQIGNAVPVNMMRYIALHIRKNILRI
jgi:DNA (cytosine-5)-methyltransferase 1